MGGVCGISLSPPHTLSPLEVSSRFSKTKHVRCAQRIRRCSIHQTPHRAERLMHILCYWPRRFVYVSLPPFTAISAAGPIPRSHSLLPRARRKPNQQQCVPLARILPIWKLFGHIFSAPTPPSDGAGHAGGSPCGRQFLDARSWLSLLSLPELRSLGLLVPIPTSIHLESGRRVLHNLGLIMRWMLLGPREAQKQKQVPVVSLARGAMSFNWPGFISWPTPSFSAGRRTPRRSLY